MQGSRFFVPISIQQDSLPENSETFEVLLSSTSPEVTVNPSQDIAMVTILGDSKHNNNIMRHWGLQINLYAGILFQFSQNAYSVDEGDPVVEVCVDLISGVLNVNTPIEITTTPGTAGGNLVTTPSEFCSLILTNYSQWFQFHSWNSDCSLSFQLISWRAKVYRYSHSWWCSSGTTWELLCWSFFK